jgi:ABC-type uncharacterized transport system involved in gliding motility auxiliary subunit
MLKIGSGAAGLILLLFILGAVNLILSNLRVRKDLTQEKLFTLSKGTRQVLGQLDRNVTLKFYFSASLPDAPMFIKSYGRQVEDLLREYQLAGKGRITLEVYDPKPDSDAEESAQRYGIEGQPIGMFTPPLYFGVVAKSGEQEQSLPALSPRDEASLEYELTRLITRVAWPKKPVIGVLSGNLNVLGNAMPMMMPGQPRGSQPWVAFREMKRDYDVKAVDSEIEAVDSAITTLIVVHPKNLSDKTLFAIDQFVLRGGKLIVCVDPFSVADMESSGAPNMMMGMGGNQGPSSLGKLFDAWGIGFNTAKLVADLKAVTRLGGSGRVEESPVFLSLGAQNVAKDDLLAGQLGQIMFPFAGEIVDQTAGALQFTPIIQSSDAACLVDAAGAQFGMAAIRAQLKPDKMRHVLAARLKGTFKTAFPNGKPAGAEGEPGDTNSVPNRLVSGESTVLIFGDTDFLFDRFCVQQSEGFFGVPSVQPINDNITLLGNAVEQTAGREELILIRSRGRSNRPFEVVNELEYKAMVEWQQQEEQLQQSLEATRKQLADLQQQKPGSQKFILSDEQQKAVERFRQQEIETSRQLKNVRKSLNKDIESLGVRVKAANIVLVPLLLIVFGVGRHMLRNRRA